MNAFVDVSMMMREGLAQPHERQAQHGDRSILPPGTTVVTADSHWSVSEDIWYEAFPPSLRDKAPRVYGQDGMFQLDVDGKPLLSSHADVLQSFESVPGCYRMEPRLKDLAAEGIDKEIVFPNTTMGLLFFGTSEVRNLVIDIYNDYMADLAKQAPDVFYPVAFVNFWDMAKVDASVQRIVDLGIKTIFLPQHPRDCNGQAINYAMPEYDRLWSALEQAGLPVNFHIGEGSAVGPGGAPTQILMNMAPFRGTFGQLVYGGILDRHPELKIVWTECNISGIPSMLQDAEMCLDSFKGFTLELKLRPTEYWHRNFWVTMMTDELGLRMLDLIGADRVLYGPDYPHCESTLGYNWDAMKAIVDATGPDISRKILGGTAMKLFKL